MVVIKKGDRGESVKALQRLLHLVDDGVFGPITEDAVKHYQREKGLRVDGVVGFATWDSLGVHPWERAASIGVKMSKRNIKEIIVHCSATGEGKPFTVEDIRRWHKQQGWSDIGYHYVVYLDGSVHEGRDVDLVGAHCAGHNACSVGVCYIGGVAADGKTPKDTRTEEQKRGLADLLKELKEKYPSAKIYGHHDFDRKKACPSFDARKEYRDCE